LICHFNLSFASIERRWEIDFSGYFSQELNNLQDMAADDLVCLDDQGIRIKPKGRLLIRNICMQFDAYINSKESSSSFSKVI
jgi:oxygen-independent coproporphyrinogen-3 oxidase